MDRKKDTGDNWIIFSVLVTVVPVLFAVLIFCIVNARLPDWSEILNDIMLVVFSIACSLISLCADVRRQKCDKRATYAFGFSGIVICISWSLYIVTLTNKLTDTGNLVITIADVILIITCICLGKSLGKKYDDNEKERIQSMHNNCKQIQDKLFVQRYKSIMQDYMLRKDDLLCNPDNFDRVQNVIDRRIGRSFEE